MVNKNRSHVVTGHLDTNVDQIVKPLGTKRVRVVGITFRLTSNNVNELVGENLVTVEEKVVAEPTHGRSKETMPVMVQRKLERSNVVTRGVQTCLSISESALSVLDPVVTVVREVKRDSGNKAKRHTERELSGIGLDGRLECVVEDQEKDNQKTLVHKLTPTLHQESQQHVTTTVKTVSCDRSKAVTVTLHSTRRGHGVLTTHTNTIDKQRPSIANDPTVHGDTPHARKHYRTQRHDQSILHHTKLTTNPVTFNTDKNLTGNNTDNFEVVDGTLPVLITDGLLLPALVELAGLSRHVRLARQGSIRVLEEWLDVTDGEQRVTFNKHTHTIHHIGAEIAGYNTKWVLLDHTTNVTELLAANRV